jgi:hypothetical protein
MEFPPYNDPTVQYFNRQKPKFWELVALEYSITSHKEDTKFDRCFHWKIISHFVVVLLYRIFKIIRVPRDKSGAWGVFLQIRRYSHDGGYDFLSFLEIVLMKVVREKTGLKHFIMYLYLYIGTKFFWSDSEKKGRVKLDWIASTNIIEQL